ncbi:MAG TPA: tryptophan synthase subunit alpha, partial [Rubricoccaceae bacterium]
RNPLLVGFGVRTPEDAARLAPHVDGVIVGSALIEHVERLWDGPPLSTSARLGAVAEWTRAMKAAL